MLHQKLIELIKRLFMHFNDSKISNIE